MGVYVKSMEMPINCGDCPMKDCLNWHFDAEPIYCPVLQDDEGMMIQIGTIGTPMNSRHPNCPLVDIPAPHGRLCDADAVRECLEDGEDSQDKFWALSLLDWAVSKRTVIEAEGID